MQRGMIGLGRMGACVLTTALYDRFTSRGESDFADTILSAMRFQFERGLVNPVRYAG